MANLKFWNIGKANEEIARLEAANALLTAQVADLIANTPKAITDLEDALRMERECEATTNGRLQAAKAELETAKAAITSKDAEIATLKAAVAAKGQEAETIAAKKALEIQASLGQSTTPPTAPANTKATIAITGLQKATAAFAAQIAKAD